MSAAMLRAAPAYEAVRVARSAALAAMLLRSQACSEGVSSDDFAALAGSLRPTLPVARSPTGPRGAAAAPGAKPGGAAAAPGAQPAQAKGTYFNKAGKETIWQENAAANGGKNHCDECGLPLVRPPPGRRPRGSKVPDNEGQVDHIFARSKGGNGTCCNGQLLCGPCNRNKGDKHAVSWKRNPVLPTPRPLR